MTEKEMGTIMDILSAAYPMYYKNSSSEEKIAAFKLYYIHFGQYSKDLMFNVVNAYIASDTKGFPPAIGQLKEKLLQITEPKALTEQEAWNYVAKALRNSLYNAKAEFDKLPDEIKGIVGSHNQLREWAMMDSERVNSVVSSNFMRSYKVRVKHEREMLTLPNQVREFISIATQDKLLLE